MNKHTPGPWEFCTRLQPSENHRGYYIKCKKFIVAFEVIPVDQDGKEGEANARLMAAAPELLEALLQANVQLDMASECIEAGRLDEARLHVNSMRSQRWAIANKATGAA